MDLSRRRLLQGGALAGIGAVAGCLGGRTRRPRWTFETEGFLEAGPKVADGRVYAADDRGTLSAVSARTGRREWHHAAESNGASAGLGVDAEGVFVVLAGTASSFSHGGTRRWGIDWYDGAPAPVVEGGRLYLGDSAGVAAVSTAGRSLWRHVPEGVQLPYSWVVAPPAGGDRVFLGNSEGVSALSVGTGERLWNVSLPETATSPARLDEGTVVVGCRDGSIRAVSVADGTERWRSDAFSDVLAAPVARDGVVYVAGADGTVSAVADGTVQWSKSLADQFFYSPTVAGDTVYASADRTYAIDADSGSVRWTFGGEGYAKGAPTRHEDGLYVTFGSTLYALPA